MAKEMRRGSELSNISETWDQNESKRQSDNPGQDDATAGGAPEGSELEQAIEEEAAEYDFANKEDRTLGGDRASLNDEDSGTATGE